MLRMRFLFLVLALLLAPVMDANAAMTHVSILHRHGARSEPLFPNMGLRDATQLTPNGEIMMLNLGKLLRATYGTFITSYDPAMYDTFSEYFDNCIQSAHGVLRAFFNKGSQFLPIVRHAPAETDWLLGFNHNFPNVYARPQWFFAYWNNDALARGILSTNDIEMLSNEFGSWCAEKPMQCALFAADALQSRISEKSLPQQLQTLFQEKLLPIVYGWNKHTYGFNLEDPYVVIGSPAYTLAAKVLHDAEVGEKKFCHYSVHDSTILGLLNALGAIQLGDTNPRWLPRFGSVLAVTTYSNGNVSFTYAEPQQEAGSSLDYVSGLLPITVRCKTFEGAEYMASTCPLNDVWRYVNRSRPTVADPFCYLRPEDGCDVLETVPSEHCQYYRKYCPIGACGPNAGLDASRNYTCFSFFRRRFTKDYTLASIVAGVCGGAVGLIVGFLISLLLQKTEEKEVRRRRFVQMGTGETNA
ncbi:membrane-bound acid phosphatase 2, putative [Trypanosoma cruzi]|nr:membrane-bound acid phosphatase 2, putative [Trypanosoma cruzi]